MFQQLKRLSPDSILGLMAIFRSDPASHKVDLGVGVYRDLSGNTPVLDCVRRAEREVLSIQNTKSYVGAAGREEFNSAVEALVLGARHPALTGGRVRSLQTPGGCGALRIGAELIRAAAPQVTVHLSDPTWGNHAPLLGNAGLRLASYPYYDATGHSLRFAAMMECLEQVPECDVVLIHACCHNPTGADLDLGQWQALAALLERRHLTPFLDLAYQGFGVDLEQDAGGVRLLAERLPEALIAISYSKNLGLYRERVGSLITVGANASSADAAQSHVLQIARGIYSMPPDHGAAIAARIFAEENLARDWRVELAAMRTRMVAMRGLLADALRKSTGGGEFEFLRTQHGMFSLLGISPAAVATLRERHHIYMLHDSRMNVAGIMPHNAAYVADAVAATLAERAA